MRILTNTRPVLLQVVYYLPDYPSVLQQFIWGLDDEIPDLRRTHRFLHHWHHNIDAVISEVLISISNGPSRNWRPVDELINLH